MSGIVGCELNHRLCNVDKQASFSPYRGILAMVLVVVRQVELRMSFKGFLARGFCNSQGLEGNRRDCNTMEKQCGRR
jgi:hypothetical protein